MRTKQSATATGMYSRSGPFTPPMPILAAPMVRGLGRVRGAAEAASAATVPVVAGAVDSRQSSPVGANGPVPERAGPGTAGKKSGLAQGAGLLHDTRNLVGALGLYCDLLSMPGVLKPEHLHYAEELRLVGTRSGALMERLTARLALVAPASGAWEGPSTAAGSQPAIAAASPDPANPVSLRMVVARCSGLLSQMAGGRVIEVSYGAAAAVPVLVAEEAIERILVNLVRNAAAALDRGGAAGGVAAKVHRDRVDDCETGDGSGHLAAGGPVALGPVALGPVLVRETSSDGTEDETPGAIRVGVGLLVNRVGDPRPWPFRRVRLTVEDSGCGMAPEQLERLLCGSRAPSRGSRGIGFSVVRELVSASDGDLRAMSAPGVGTRVQIEWPVAGMASLERNERNERNESGRRTGGEPYPARRARLPAPLEKFGLKLRGGAQRPAAKGDAPGVVPSGARSRRATGSASANGRSMSC